MSKTAAWRSLWADFYPQKSSSKTCILYAASMLFHLQSKITTELSSVYAVCAFIYSREKREGWHFVLHRGEGKKNKHLWQKQRKWCSKQRVKVLTVIRSTMYLCVYLSKIWHRDICYWPLQCYIYYSWLLGKILLCNRSKHKRTSWLKSFLDKNSNNTFSYTYNWHVAIAYMAEALTVKLSEIWTSILSTTRSFRSQSLVHSYIKGSPSALKQDWKKSK